MATKQIRVSEDLYARVQSESWDDETLGDALDSHESREVSIEDPKLYLVGLGVDVDEEHARGVTISLSSYRNRATSLRQ